jgi:DNA gyrase subunit B
MVFLPAIHGRAKQGIEAKRFNGFGEMNAGQLWETRLNPTMRPPRRVRLQEAGEAERMISVAIRDDVERRGQFFEDHALEGQSAEPARWIGIAAKLCPF